MTIFNPYKPTDPDIEYADVIHQERIEQVDNLRPDFKTIFLDIFKSVLPDQLPGHIPVHHDKDTGVNVLMNQYKFLFWQGNLVAWEIDARIPSFMEEWMGTEEWSKLDELDEILAEKYNLEW